MFVPGSSITSSHSSIADQKVTLVFFLGGVTFAEIAALRFLAQQDDGKQNYHKVPKFFDARKLCFNLPKNSRRGKIMLVRGRYITK